MNAKRTNPEQNVSKTNESMNVVGFILFHCSFGFVFLNLFYFQRVNYLLIILNKIMKLMMMTMIITIMKLKK